jgi:hypothetical protein
MARLAQLEDAVGRLLARQNPPLHGPRSQVERLRASELQIWSQNGEDGILLELFGEIGPATRTTIEFGVQDGRECNSANLILSFAWSGLLMDADASSVEAAKTYYHSERSVPPERLQIQQQWITAENVDAVIERAGFHGEMDLLSIDVDGNDYWIWKAIKCVRPRVLVIEYNGILGGSESYTSAYEPELGRGVTKSPASWHYGASLAALVGLGASKGYSLVGCNSTGVNAFFVRSDLLRAQLSALDSVTAFHPGPRRLRRRPPQSEVEALKRTLVKDPDAAG